MSAKSLQELLGLSDDELLAILHVGPLELIGGDLEHRSELPILIALLEEATERSSPAVLRSWLRSTGPHGRPLDLLLERDFAGFEDALGALAERGFVLSSGTGRPR